MNDNNYNKNNIINDSKSSNIDRVRDRDFICLDNSRSKNDKNWENWERIREQKLEKMRSICFDSYRQSKWNKAQEGKPKKKQLDPTWYTDNIYSNRSEDLEEDYIKYNTYHKLRNIREQDEFYADNDIIEVNVEDEISGKRIDGEGSPRYGMHRSLSCKELFHLPKSKSCCFKNINEHDNIKTTSILKNRSAVPKSYSFSATSKTTPFDVMDYELKLPPVGRTRREKQEAHRKAMGYHYSSSLDETAFTNIHAHDVHPCCTREYCTNPKCLLNEIYPPNVRPCRHSTLMGGYGAGGSEFGSRSHHMSHDWEEDPRSHHMSSHPRYSQSDCKYDQTMSHPYTMIVCCPNEDYCCQRFQQYCPNRYSRFYCPTSHHPAAEEEEYLHCKTPYDTTDLDHYIRSEREHLMMQDKFIEDDERYLSSSINKPKYQNPQYHQYPQHNRNLLMPAPSRFDEDSCSDSTEVDLEDFNIDLEKYWEELEKPPSPIDLDMQQRNMQSNLKVKNVNVGCYNNGTPIDVHDREQERMIIKKSLLDGMPSPPQPTSADVSLSHNPNNFSFFEQSTAPLSSNTYGYGHKVYPFEQTVPSYKYNNFYPEQNTIQMQQPVTARHHHSANGNSALSLINNIFSIYKPNKYSSLNCQLNAECKPEPSKKMNVPSTRRPLGASHSEYMHSMKRPLIVSNEQPHFKIIPEKTGLKISPLYSFEDFEEKPQVRQKLTSTARPLMLPH